LDRDQKIVDTNYALQMITGLKKKELLNGGYRTRTFLRPDGSSMTPDEYASTRALKEDMPIFDVETGFLTEDRGVVWTQVSAAPLNMPDTSLVVITQDISERKLSEQILRQRLAELETLYESGLSLSQLLEPKQIGQKIIDVLAEKLDWYHTTIRLYHPESDSLELLAYNLAHKTTKNEWQRAGERFKTMVARPGDGLSGWALQHGETVRCSDLLRDPRYLETVPGVRSGLYVPIKTGERTIGVISVESEKPDYFTAEDEHMAVTLAAQAAISLENIRLFKDLQKSNDDLFLAYDETIEGWSQALDLRDRETEGHTQRVTTLTEELARKMGIPDSELIHIRRGSLLHDIGKMGVPDRILLKPDKLTEEEWIIMREHPVHAYNLLSHIEFLQPALNIPHYHHERWDGSGYPDGLIGEQIPLEARIFAIIDVFDALISDRPYRPGWPRDKAINYICESSGSHFDPKVVEVFMKMISRMK
jgi:putative nucleotidyltransferase with HDIG domain/PAS domain S-box-containing protein